MGLQASFHHFIFKLKSENRKDYIYPKWRKISCHEKRQNSSWSFRKSSISSRARLMTARFKLHTTCPSKYRIKDGELSVADHVEDLCVGFTEAMGPCSEVPSDKTSPYQTTSSISTNSGNRPPAPVSMGHGSSPFVEVDRHTSVGKCDSIMADVRSIHATHSGKPQGNLPSTLNSQITPQSSPTNNVMDQNRVQTSPTSVLPREPLPNAIYISNSTRSYDFPMTIGRTVKRLEDEVHRSYEELRTLKKEIAGLRDKESELQQRNQRDREECSRAAAMSGWIRVATRGDSRLDNLSKVFQGEDQAKDALREELSKVMIFRNDMLPEGLPQKRAKKFLLEALLAHHVFTNVFSSPFSFLGDESTSLDSIYRAGLSWSVADANKWRSDTLRLLFPEASENDKAEAVRLKIPPLLDDRAKIQADNFFKSPARCFFDATPELTVGLQKIYQRAAGLAYHLWTRRSMLKIVTRKDLNSFFHIRDRQMALHTSVQEDIENKLTGQLISLVIYPGVVAYGLDECVDYETPRPWMPAKVWLHKPLSEKSQVPVGQDSAMKE
ncbi:uncharacterized protein Bfra_001553 [Botrytis fragariae]|uniref:Uncharacterized protein n=1 Tax=Botrytis fragariae TaxID=1964551 RepID=A0A8H6B142_9HELO|nr:uncharacterized protein Bfra_001553 [Botrytis fragariae]KAF5877190.1 hypothetical protein Bfra_001553 [Botrytis fragariae]